MTTETIVKLVSGRQNKELTPTPSVRIKAEGRNFTVILTEKGLLGNYLCSDFSQV